MTLSRQEVTAPSAAARGHTLLPWAAALALLVAEYLFATYAVNLRPLAAREDGLAVLAGSGYLGPVLLAVLTASLLLDRGRFVAELQLASAAALAAPRSQLRRVAFVALHVASFLLFCHLADLFSGATEAPLLRAGLLALGCVVSVALACLALAQALFPLRALIPLACRLGGPLALGATTGLTAWLAGIVAIRLWEPLRWLTLEAVAGVLRIVAGAEVISDAATARLGVQAFHVVIEPACSGYEGMGVLAILTAAYLWAFRSSLRFPHALALLPIGIVLSWLANVLRIAALMLVGAHWSPEVALGGFHSKAGWVLFCGIALGMVALSQRSELFSCAVPTHAPGSTCNPTAAYLNPLLALIAAHMVVGLFSPGFPLLYPLAALACGGALWWYRGYYTGLLRLRWSWGAATLGVAAFAIWVALEPTPDPRAPGTLRPGLAELSPLAATAWLVFRVLGSVVIVPIAEELAFRGYLFRRLISPDFVSVSFSRIPLVPFLISSAAFGLLHQRWLAGLLAGMLFCLAQCRRGLLMDAVLAHAVANLLIAIAVLARGRWELWS